MNNFGTNGAPYPNKSYNLLPTYLDQTLLSAYKTPLLKLEYQIKYNKTKFLPWTATNRPLNRLDTNLYTMSYILWSALWFKNKGEREGREGRREGEGGEHTRELWNRGTNITSKSIQCIVKWHCYLYTSCRHRQGVQYPCNVLTSP